MKNIIFVILLFLFSCKQADQKPVVIEKVKVDTVFIPKIDTVIVEVEKENVGVIKLQKDVDSLKVANNKLGKELLHSKQVIENAKYYLNIVNKNPSQQKFLRGWMNRALNQ